VSLQKTKEQLIQLLNDADNSVIALSGKWGTGKTHLWNEVKAESLDDKVSNALYVSLFGLSNIDQLKRKLIEAVIPGVESHGGTFDAIKNLYKAGVTAAAKHYKALAAINDVNLLLVAPAVLRKKLIVIDDIERKHEKLGIDEVLGFIDEYSKQRSAKFVLLLNDDKLSSKATQALLWETFREKIIDQEIRLSTSSEEAFSIAIGLRPSKYAEAIRWAVITCGLTNIRIVTKVIKVVNQVLADLDLDENIVSRVVPSIVLFSAIYYRGLESGPDFKFALNVGSFDWDSYFKDDNEEPTDTEQKERAWRILMQDLGINACDEFEEKLVEFLESGLFDPSSIEAIIKRYRSEGEAMAARSSAQKFINRILWDHRVHEEQLVDEANSLTYKAHLLDPYLVTELNSLLAELPGGDVVGEKIIDSWVTNFRALGSAAIEDDNPFNNPIHPKIQAEFDSVESAAHSDVNVVDACIHIIENNGWNTLQKVVLSQATADDFETAIREADIDTFRKFMHQMIRMRQNRETFDPHFGTATDRFVEACCNIAQDKDSPRLSKLIHRLFEHGSLASEITSSQGPLN
jgi:hypothetical protein